MVVAYPHLHTLIREVWERRSLDIPLSWYIAEPWQYFFFGTGMHLAHAMGWFFDEMFSGHGRIAPALMLQLIWNLYEKIFSKNHLFVFHMFKLMRPVFNHKFIQWSPERSRILVHLLKETIRKVYRIKWEFFSKKGWGLPHSHYFMSI